MNDTLRLPRGQDGKHQYLVSAIGNIDIFLCVTHLYDTQSGYPVYAYWVECNKETFPEGSANVCSLDPTDTVWSIISKECVCSWVSDAIHGVAECAVSCAKAGPAEAGGEG